MLLARGLKNKSSIFSLALLLNLLTLAAFSSPDANYALATSCSIQLTDPIVKSVSSVIGGATAGQQFIITTTISNNCLEENMPFVALIEARNSDGVTESLTWQSGILEGFSTNVEVGASWIPEHADNYELRAFVISDPQNPQVLSLVKTGRLAVQGVHDIPRCTQNPDAVGSLRELVATNSTSVFSEDQNLRLTLYTNSSNLTEYENQYFSVEIYNKANHPVVLPAISGAQYTIAFYGQEGESVTRLGGHQQPYYEGSSDELLKPACSIYPGESVIFSPWTRFGTKDHDTPSILFASAFVAYFSNGKSEFLRTAVGEEDRHLTRDATNLLKIVVSPVKLAEMNKTQYFDASLALPYVPKVGEERPLWVIARTTHYRGDYTVQVYLPEGMELVSGKTSTQGYFWPDKYISAESKLIVKGVEQEASKMVIRSTEAGNYAIKSVIYVNFNGTIIGNEDVIWFSTSEENSSPSVSRTPLPHSIEPQVPANSHSIEVNNPIPTIRVGIPDSGKIYNATTLDFCWSDIPKWWEPDSGSIFDTICDFSYPLSFTKVAGETPTQQLTTANGSLVNVLIENTVSRPSLVLIDIYIYEDISTKNRDISGSYPSCVIYSPTGGHRLSNPYQQCPLATSVSLINTTQAYDLGETGESAESSYSLSIMTPKPGLHILGVYAQWASEEEIKEYFAYRSVYYQFEVLIV